MRSISMSSVTRSKALWSSSLNTTLSRPCQGVETNTITFIIFHTAESPTKAYRCESRGCNYSFWASDDGRFVAWNMLRNWEKLYLQPLVYILVLCGCQPLRWPTQPSHLPATKNICKPEAVITVFELLMMDGVSPEICWAIKIHCSNKFYYTVASCWFFLWDLYYDARIREHQTSNKCVIHR
jgi:hypothetical protein